MNGNCSMIDNNIIIITADRESQCSMGGVDPRLLPFLLPGRPFFPLLFRSRCLPWWREEEDEVSPGLELVLTTLSAGLLALESCERLSLRAMVSVSLSMSRSSRSCFPPSHFSLTSLRWMSVWAPQRVGLRQILLLVIVTPHTLVSSFLRSSRLSWS